MNATTLAGLAIALAVLGRSTRTEQPVTAPSNRPPFDPPTIDQRSALQLATLAPYFRDAVARVVERMRALGWDAVVHEGLRSAARAKQLANEGKGVFPSLHQYGLAADITSRSRGWQVPDGFWADLETAAKAEGLTSGRRWTRPDPAHVQAVPVSEQNAAMGWAVAQRDAKLRDRFG